MKRKIAGIILSLFLIAPVIATFTYLHYQKKQVKRTVKWNMIAGLDKSELVLLTFSKPDSENELEWKHSKEFGYQGEMYDIVEKKVVGDSIQYWCWWDYAETKLNKQLDHLLANVLGNDSQRKDKKDQLLDVYKKLFYELETARITFTPPSKSSTFHYKNQFNQIYFSPVPPPPQLV
jgi:hypothetical protein